MTTGDITIDAAVIGTIISAGFQALKLLPVKWLEKLLTPNPETQRTRLQAAIFGTILVAVGAQMASTGALTLEHADQLLGMVAVALTTAYGVYKQILSSIADKYPEWFQTTSQAPYLGPMIDSSDAL